MNHTVRFICLLGWGVAIGSGLYILFLFARLGLQLRRVMRLRQQREEVFARFMQAHRDEDWDTFNHWAAEHKRLAELQIKEMEKV